MDIEAKIKDDMRSLGCDDEKKIALAYCLYLHLVDEKLMYDTEYCYNKDIDTLYVVARPNKTAKINIYVPIPICDEQSFDFTTINKLQENLCTVETGPVVNLAFIESDSTTVIYSFTKGLLPRPTPEMLQAHREREQRRLYINTELQKNKRDILHSAIYGGVVDDDDCQLVE